VVHINCERERAELERKFQKFARENPFHPTVIDAIACRVANPRNDGPCECVKDWLALALRQPNNPRVIRVRKLIADRAAKRERRKNGPVFIEPFRLPFQMESVAWDEQQRQRNVETVPSSTKPAQKSERLYPVLSEEQMEALFDDLADYLQITRAFKRFTEMHSGNSTVN